MLSFLSLLSLVSSVDIGIPKAVTVYYDPEGTNQDLVREEMGSARTEMEFYRDNFDTVLELTLEEMRNEGASNEEIDAVKEQAEQMKPVLDDYEFYSITSSSGLSDVKKTDLVYILCYSYNSETNPLDFSNLKSNARVYLVDNILYSRSRSKEVKSNFNNTFFNFAKSFFKTKNIDQGLIKFAMLQNQFQKQIKTKKLAASQSIYFVGNDNGKVDFLFLNSRTGSATFTYVNSELRPNVWVGSNCDLQYDVSISPSSEYIIFDNAPSSLGNAHL